MILDVVDGDFVEKLGAVHTEVTVILRWVAIVLAGEYRGSIIYCLCMVA